MRESAAQSGAKPDPGVYLYQLRAQALDRKLTLFELGRVLYHLAQRRGFKSNRKSDRDEIEDGVVKAGISSLQKEMESSEARTLGEFYSKSDPHLRRIRQQWTARSMYEKEFKSIWKAQVIHYPDLLTPGLFGRVERSLFYQRPLKSQKHLIGKCSLEKGRRKAPWCCLDAQRFRYLQRINDLELFIPGQPVRGLDEKERMIASDFLEGKERVTFRQLAKAIGIKDARFNLEEGGEKNLIGNRTNAKLYKIIGDPWLYFEKEKKDVLVDEIFSIQKPETLVKRAQEAWGLEREIAKAIGEIRLEDGFCSFSRKALKKILPQLERGLPIQTIIKNVYNVQDEKKETLDLLPPIASSLSDLRNPVVSRALTELRKVVNSIIRQYGKPEIIRVELARSLRNSPKRRQEIIKKNRANQRGREKAAQKILDEVGIQNPKRDDVLRVLLAEECKWVCPYTGKSINMGSLFGPQPQFDIEHIIPFERSLDNSYMNKTLCCSHENRVVKQNMTPFEAYSGNVEKWEQILMRISAKDGLPAPKHRRFTMEAEELEAHLAGFSNQQLTNTAYASRLAVQYLGELYGGDVDANGKRRIFIVSGQATGVIRRELGLLSILNEGEIKKRDDHRHHAVDSMAIALTTPKMIQELSRASEKARLHGGRSYGLVPQPWDGFLKDAIESIGDINVSHRPERRVQGGLHEDSFYSSSRDEDGGRKEGGKFIHIRKPLVKMSKKDVENIVDPEVRSLVRAASSAGKPEKVFSDPEKLPVMRNGDGRKMTIKKARIRKAQSTLKIGTGGGARYVASGSNHHVEILEGVDKKGKLRWEGVVISRFEAMQRVKRGCPVVQRDHGFTADENSPTPAD